MLHPTYYLIDRRNIGGSYAEVCFENVEAPQETAIETEVAFPLPSLDTESFSSAPVPFDDILSEATARGACSVSVIVWNGTTFFVPSGGPQNYNIIAWGNGTGGPVPFYSDMLEQLASHCIIVAAATTLFAGDGLEMRDAVITAKEQFSAILSPELRICTSGHSQGGIYRKRPKWCQFGVVRMR